MKNIAIAVVILAALASRARPARAQEPPPPAATTTTPETYGYQIFLADTALIGSMFATGGVTLFAYPFAGPLIHVLHHRGDRAAISFLLRLGLPLAGAYTMAALTRCSGEEFLCPVGEAIAGGALGVLAASIIDASMAAWPSDESAPPPAARPAPKALSFAPTFAALPSGVHLGLAGRF